jgi:hypothetical protein
MNLGVINLKTNNSCTQIRIKGWMDGWIDGWLDG